MKIFTLGIQYKNGRLDQYELCPRSFLSNLDEELTIRLEFAPYVQVHGTEVNCNFDALLVTKRNTGAREFNAYVPTISLGQRISKTAQALRSNAVGSAQSDRFRQQNLYMYETYSEPDEAHKLPFGANLPEVCLLRPEYGAEGASQILWPTKKISLDALSNAAKTPESRQHAALDYPGLVFTQHRNKRSSENPSFPPIRRMCCTEFIPNIAAEYRIISNGTDERLVYKRVRKDGAYPQVDNTPIGVEVGIPLGRSELMMFEADVNAVLDVLSPIGAADIFLDTDGKWGIFEYGLQYGVYGCDPDQLMGFHVSGLSKLVDDFIKGAKAK